MKPLPEPTYAVRLPSSDISFILTCLHKASKSTSSYPRADKLIDEICNQTLEENRLNKLINSIS